MSEPKTDAPTQYACEYCGSKTHEERIRMVLWEGDRLVVVRPPLRDGFRSRIPHEAEFDARLESFLTRRAIPLHDLSTVSYAPEYFFDPDHLNRDGAQRFLEERWAPALRPYLQSEPANPEE